MQKLAFHNFAPMTPELKAFISNYVSMDEAELDYIAGLFKPRKLKKNEFLLQQGTICSDVVFVQEGCVRLYYVDEDVEISVWFTFAQSSAIDIYSFISGKPSIYFLQAIDETEIWSLPKAELLKLYQTHPKMQEMMRCFWEDAVLNLIDRFTALQRDTAEERYLDLLSKPAYMQKIPQKYLASFIGVTPTSLSRIRKHIR